MAQSGGHTGADVAEKVMGSGGGAFVALGPGDLPRDVHPCHCPTVTALTGKGGHFHFITQVLLCAAG